MIKFTTDIKVYFIIIMIIIKKYNLENAVMLEHSNRITALFIDFC